VSSKLAKKSNSELDKNGAAPFTRAKTKMLFTYVFGDKLDITKFRKQAAHYISTMSEVRYHLYLPNYKIHLEVSTPNDQGGHIVAASLFQLKRDEMKEIIRADAIYPITDSRFSEIKVIQDIWNPWSGILTVPSSAARATFTSNSVVESVEKICVILKIVSKIDGLKAFC
jgi:hypothetical protein